MKNKYNIPTREYKGETRTGKTFSFVGFSKGDIRQGFESATDKGETVNISMDIDPSGQFLLCSLHCILDNKERNTSFSMRVCPEDLEDSNKWRGLLSVCEKRLKVMTLGLGDAEDEADEAEEIETAQADPKAKSKIIKSIPEQIGNPPDYKEDPEYLETPLYLRPVFAIMFYSGFTTAQERRLLLAKIYTQNHIEKVANIPKEAKSYFFDICDGFQASDHKGNDRTPEDRLRIKNGLWSLVTPDPQMKQPSI